MESCSWPATPSRPDELALRVEDGDAEVVHLLLRGLRRDDSAEITPRSDVPACSPRMPCEANMASVPVVCSIETPMPAATGPTYLSAPARS
jgi:hypothetical protein